MAPDARRRESSIFPRSSRFRKMVRAGGQVPTHTEAPASARLLAMANPNPPSSATPATNARRPVRSIFSMPVDRAVTASGQEEPHATGPVGVPLFSRGLWRVASANVSSGNRVHLLHDGPETFDAMIALIESATESVSLESYIFRSDEVG